MAVTTNWYRKSFVAILNKEVDWGSDTIKVALATASYTPDLDAHDYFNDITNEVSSSGTGYTSGGATMGSCTATYTAANSWSTQWASSTAFAAEAIVRPTTGNGYLYRAQGSGGTSGGSQPTWPTTIGDEVADSGVTWTCIGKGILVLDGADVSWSTATITARYGIVYDSTPGTSSTNPLIGLMDFGEDKSSSGATFSITWNALGILYLAIH